MRTCSAGAVEESQEAAHQRGEGGGQAKPCTIPQLPRRGAHLGEGQGALWRGGGGAWWEGVLPAMIVCVCGPKLLTTRPRIPTRPGCRVAVG